MKGYKAFSTDLTCRDFKFKVGKTYEIRGTLQICSNGFHFCENLFDVYNYYAKSSDTRICEIEALGEVIKEGDKSVTSKIKIVRELSDKERLDAWIKRTKSGNYNSGDYNSGYRNSGNYNSGNYNSGYFNTNSPGVRLFNRTFKLAWNDPRVQAIRYLPVKPVLLWVWSESMTEVEKVENPSHSTTGGYLKNTGKTNWNDLTKEHWVALTQLPGFDTALFEQATGTKFPEEYLPKKRGKKL